MGRGILRRRGRFPATIRPSWPLSGRHIGHYLHMSRSSDLCVIGSYSAFPSNRSVTGFRHRYGLRTYSGGTVRDFHTIVYYPHRVSQPCAALIFFSPYCIASIIFLSICFPTVYPLFFLPFSVRYTQKRMPLQIHSEKGEFHAAAPLYNPLNST